MKAFRRLGAQNVEFKLKQMTSSTQELVTLLGRRLVFAPGLVYDSQTSLNNDRNLRNCKANGN
jgi:hypothetical protein